MIYVLLFLMAIVLGGAALTYFYKERIIAHFVEEANQYLQTPVKVGKITVSSLNDFPNITLIFHDVKIEESLDPAEFNLLEAEKLQFSFNPILLAQGDYYVNHIKISHGSARLRKDRAGKRNYLIFKDTSQKDSLESKELDFDLEKITLDDVAVMYTDPNAAQQYELTANLTANLRKVGLQYLINLRGDTETGLLSMGGQRYLQGKRFFIASQLSYHDQMQELRIEPSLLKTGLSRFVLSGSYHLAGGERFKISLKNSEADIQALLALLPAAYTQSFDDYNSSGEIYFDLLLEKPNTDARPALTIKFGMNGARIYHKKSGFSLNEATIRGSFVTADVHNPRRAVLDLQGVEGNMNGQSFTGSLSIRDFQHHLIDLDFRGGLDLGALHKFYPLGGVETIRGMAFMAVDFTGKASDIKKKINLDKLKASGEIDLENVDLQLKDLQLPFRGLKGNLLFNKNDIAISDVTGKFGKSDFRLNGFLKDIVTYLFKKNEPLNIESDLKANLIDLDELLTLHGEERSRNQQYSFEIPKGFNLKFNCDIQSLKFRRFKPRQIKGDLQVKDRLAVTRKLSLQAMGGQIELSGIVDDRNSQQLEIATHSQLNGINIDSIFFVFENFNQDFLTDAHLKGRIFASIDASMDLDHHLNLISQSLVADIVTTIRQGELNDFEPMMKLANYLDEEQLDRLRFSDIENNIHIENQTIYLPQMEVKSNVTDIKITGTHTFDQRINYRLVTPLTSKASRDKDERFGAVEQDVTGRSLLFLKITGSTNHYKIAYDSESVKKKIVADLKKEVLELKQAFQNKGLKKAKEQELAEDDYFDWDDH